MLVISQVDGLRVPRPSPEWLGYTSLGFRDARASVCHATGTSVLKKEGLYCNDARQVQ